MDANFSSETLPPQNVTLPNGSTEAQGSAVRLNESAISLGIWLSGLQSFLHVRNYAFNNSKLTKISSRDWAKEFQLTHSTLLLCSKLNLELLSYLGNQETNGDEAETGVSQPIRFEFTFEEIAQLSDALKQSILLNEVMLRAEPLKLPEWTAWSASLSEKLYQLSAVTKIIREAERVGETFLPKELQNILSSNPLSYKMEADYRIILPRIAKILKWLDLVKSMLNNDEPLKPTLLLFAHIYEQTHEMISYIKNRLKRFPNQDDPIFIELDVAIYCTGMEARKVFEHELSDVTEIRQTPLIFAKIERSFALLNDSLQLSLVNLAKLIDPNLDKFKMFPNLRLKYDKSIKLRNTLWDIQRTVSEAEHNPETFPLQTLRDKLSHFLADNLDALFYKDAETLERFAEEILESSSKNDLVPTLHRFGAYLETLLGQVNMRIILADQPFEYPT